MMKDGTEITAPHDIAEAFAEVLAGIPKSQPASYQACPTPQLQTTCHTASTSKIVKLFLGYWIDQPPLPLMTSCL